DERRPLYLGRPAGYGLDLEEVLQPVLAALSAEARLLVAAEGAAGAAARAVHLHHAAAKLARDAPGPFRVAGLDIARQAVGRVVGDLDRLFLRLERDHGKDRTEHLLARDRHVVGNVGKHG